ncbi:MAG: DUF2851 family protein [Chitinophagaceae bacterium]
MIHENLLAFIWQYRYYSKQLYTTQGETLSVIQPGLKNTHEGPDFTNATIQVQGTTLVGNVEIHVKASDWYAHHHTANEHYRNVILHVVWDADAAIHLPQGTHLPTLALCNFVSQHLLAQYRQLMLHQQTISCSWALPALSNLGWQAWLERLAIERLTAKFNAISNRLSVTQQHWEQVLWELTARYFGGTVNGDLFANTAAQLPVTTLAKCKHQPDVLMALCFGTAQLLPIASNDNDAYTTHLIQQYKFGVKAYRIASSQHYTPAYLRMRPHQFPTIRMAQLATLVLEQQHLFSKILAAENIYEVKGLFTTTAPEYWHHRYRFNDLPMLKKQPKTTGEQLLNSICINVVVPLLFAYGKYHQQEQKQQQAIDWLQQLPAEVNHVTKQFKQYGVVANNAMMSQGLLQLQQQYCSNKHCLSCAVGNAVLKKATTTSATL